MWLISTQSDRNETPIKIDPFCISDPVVVEFHIYIMGLDSINEASMVNKVFRCFIAENNLDYFSIGILDGYFLRSNVDRSPFELPKH